jgi:hypothetical protein
VRPHLRADLGGNAETGGSVAGVTGYASSTGTDRVVERRRAVLARHYRELEDLSIRQIADRLDRAPATVKAYFYDPCHVQHLQAWGSDARPGHGTAPRGATRPPLPRPRGSVDRGDRSSAGTRRSDHQDVSLRSNRRQGTRGSRRATGECVAAAGRPPRHGTARATPTRIANAAIPARLRRNGHGNGFAKQCAHGERATALRRPRTTGPARMHADAAAKRSHEYRPENGPRRPLSSI